MDTNACEPSTRPAGAAASSPAAPPLSPSPPLPSTSAFPPLPALLPSLLPSLPTAAAAAAAEAAAPATWSSSWSLSACVITYAIAAWTLPLVLATARSAQLAGKPISRSCDATAATIVFCRPPPPLWLRHSTSMCARLPSFSTRKAQAASTRLAECANASSENSRSKPMAIIMAHSSDGPLSSAAAAAAAAGAGSDAAPSAAMSTSPAPSGAESRRVSSALNSFAADFAASSSSVCCSMHRVRHRADSSCHRSSRSATSQAPFEPVISTARSSSERSAAVALPLPGASPLPSVLPLCSAAAMASRSVHAGDRCSTAARARTAWRRSDVNSTERYVSMVGIPGSPPWPRPVPSAANAADTSATSGCTTCGPNASCGSGAPSTGRMSSSVVMSVDISVSVERGPRSATSATGLDVVDDRAAAVSGYATRMAWPVAGTSPSATSVSTNNRCAPTTRLQLSES